MLVAQVGDAGIGVAGVVPAGVVAALAAPVLTMPVARVSAGVCVPVLPAQVPIPQLPVPRCRYRRCWCRVFQPLFALPEFSASKIDYWLSPDNPMPIVAGVGKSDVVVAGVGKKRLIAGVAELQMLPITRLRNRCCSARFAGPILYEPWFRRRR